MIYTTAIDINQLYFTQDIKNRSFGIEASSFEVIALNN
jgi:hypothetical protein